MAPCVPSHGGEQHLISHAKTQDVRFPEGMARRAEIISVFYGFLICHSRDTTDLLMIAPVSNESEPACTKIRPPLSGMQDSSIHLCFPCCDNSKYALGKRPIMRFISVNPQMLIQNLYLTLSWPFFYALWTETE